VAAAAAMATGEAAGNAVLTLGAILNSPNTLTRQEVEQERKRGQIGGHGCSCVAGR